MSPRVLTPELLDQLDADHPLAIKSHLDLRRINSLLGNHRWFGQTLRRLGLMNRQLRIIEIGAGSGALGSSLQRRWPDLQYTAIDLRPPPPEWPPELNWQQGNLIDILPKLNGDILLANLILHHFEDEELAEVGKLLSSYEAVICCEPARFSHLHWLSCPLHLLGLNRVTWHDLHISINAGFRDSELPQVLALGTSNWSVQVKHTPTGMYRLIATQRS